MWQDSHKSFNPQYEDFSHYYLIGDTVGATRIDRQYLWGSCSVVKSEYIPSAFSDHFGLLTQVKVPYHAYYKDIDCSPRTSKVSNEVARDKTFHEQVSMAMTDWKRILENGLCILTWWELIVKPGIRHIAVKRSRDLQREQRGELNLLLIKQAYLVKKLRSCSQRESWFAKLKNTQSKISE